MQRLKRNGIQFKTKQIINQDLDYEKSNIRSQSKIETVNRVQC